MIGFFDAQPTTRKTPPLPSHVYFSLPPTPETVARAVCCAACCAGFGAPGLWFSSRITLLGFRRARTAEIQPRVHVARLRNTPRLHSARIYIFRFSWMIAARRWLPSEKGVARARARLRKAERTELPVCSGGRRAGERRLVAGEEGPSRALACLEGDRSVARAPRSSFARLHISFRGLVRSVGVVHAGGNLFLSAYTHRHTRTRVHSFRVPQNTATASSLRTVRLPREDALISKRRCCLLGWAERRNDRSSAQNDAAS